MSETDRRTPWSWLDEAYPYALDALDERERAEIDDRLHQAGPTVTADFHIAVRRIQETVAALSTVDEVAPPAHLEAALERALDERAVGRVHPITRRVRPSTRGRWFAVAAAVVVLVGSVLGIAVVIDRTGDGAGAITAQQVIDRPDSRAGSAPMAGGGEMTVHVSTELGAAAIAFHDMPALPADRAYQLWRTPSGGTPQSVAVVDGPGPVVATVRPTDTLAVTVEPAGGSTTPTTPPLGSMTVG